MAASENETRYPETTEFIYSVCAKRLKARKLLLGLTDAKIAAGGYDRKVVSRIINGTRTRNNPFLITPAYVKPLLENLKFESEVELFWGDVNDESFIKLFFCNLVTDILDESFWSKSEARVDLIQRVLLDDVRYAKIYPTISSEFEYKISEEIYDPISPFADVSGGEQVSPAERKEARQNAILRLFKNTRPIEMFQRFFQETNDRGENRGFKGLGGKRLDDFVNDSVMPFMRARMPKENSLGLRVYNIIASDVTRKVEAEFANMQREAAGFEKYTSPEQDEVFNALVEAAKGYIQKLGDLQERLDALLRKEKFGNT